MGRLLRALCVGTGLALLAVACTTTELDVAPRHEKTPPSLDDLVRSTSLSFQREGAAFVFRRGGRSVRVDENGAVTVDGLRVRTREAGERRPAHLSPDGSIAIEGHALTEHVTPVDGGGVEQSWTLAARPHGRELVVHVDVGGMAYAGATAKGHHFVDATTHARVRYGTATWIDHDEKSVALETRFDGQALAIHVPADVLDGATYPATIDPVLSPEMDVDVPVSGAASTANDVSLTPGPAGTFLACWTESVALSKNVVTRAARVGADGNILGATFDLFVGGGTPAVAWDGAGQRWLVSVPDGKNARYVRIAADGTRLDTVARTVPTDALILGAAADGQGNFVLSLPARDGVVSIVRIASATGDAATPVKVATGADAQGAGIACAAPAVGCAVLWATTATSLRLSRISSSDVVLDPTGVPLAVAQINSAMVASDGTQWLATWVESGGPQTLHGARLSGAGTVQPLANLDAAGFTGNTALGWNGSSFLAAWGLRTATNLPRIRMRRIAADGTFLEASPVEIDPGSGSLRAMTASASGTSVLAAWSTSTAANAPARIQPFSATLQPLGAPVPLAPSSNMEIKPILAWNGSRYLAVWLDYRDTTGTSVHAARLSATGTPLDTTATKIASSVNIGFSSYPLGAASDGDGFLVIWPAGGKVLGTRIGKDDTTPLDTTPITFGTATSSYPPAVAFDGQDYLVVWASNANSQLTDIDIVGARLSKSGTLLDTTPFTITAANNAQVGPAIASNGTISLVAWTDYRSDYYAGDLFGSRVGHGGVVLDPAGIAIAKRAQEQTSPAIAAGPGGFTVAWGDNAASAGTTNDIYVRRIDTNGAVVGPPLAVATGGDFDEPSILDMNDGISQLVAFTRYRQTEGSRVVGSWLRVGASLEVMDASPVELAPEGLSGNASLAPSAVPGQVALTYTRRAPAGTLRVRTRFVGSGTATGAACTTSTDCASRHCIDQICCAESCTDSCRRCGANGACEPVRSADDPGTCDGENTCDPEGVCRKRNGSVCTQASECASGNCVDSFCCNTPCNGACDSCSEPRGTCTPLSRGSLGAPSCSPFRCDGKAPTCATTCTTDEDCADGFGCDRPTKTCIGGPVCVDIETVRETSGARQRCAPYACRSGKCASDCSSVLDCAFPAVCEESKRCVTPPEPEALAGCSITRSRHDVGGVLTAGAVLAALLRRRRR